MQKSGGCPLFVEDIIGSYYESRSYSNINDMVMQDSMPHLNHTTFHYIQFFSLHIHFHHSLLVSFNKFPEPVPDP
jgi:hypothetical protein